MYTFEKVSYKMFWNESLEDKDFLSAAFLLKKVSYKMFWNESLEDKDFLSAAFLLKKVSREIVKGNIDFFQSKTKNKRPDNPQEG